jgi:tRNA nucleotidyltransferase (CCA-adding enzyme)
MTKNLTTQLHQHLSAEPLNLIQMAGELARQMGFGLYLVGGAVRDLLLGRTNLDLDLVVEGDAPRLADLLAKGVGGEVLVHRRFGTAKFRHENLTIDLATARAETYAHPGALPAVRPSTIKDDLSRRDFTINAMAIHLDPRDFGKLVDPFQGSEDLAQRLIRVLHEKSFIDDATRMLRAIRYEQRFDFHLHPATEALLRHDVSMLGTISGDRIRHELELILREPYPERSIMRADDLGVLREVHPPLKGNGWIAHKFGQARATTHPPSLGLYLSLLVHHLSRQEVEDLVSALNIPKATARVMRDSARLRQSLPVLDAPEMPPSAIYRLLRGYSPTSILACAIASDSPIVEDRLKLYLDRLRYVKPALDGQALKDMGIPPGPRIGEILEALRDARLDRRAKAKAEETELVRLWLSQGG